MKSYRLEECIPADRIARRVEELAAAISRDYAGEELVLIGILKGAYVFLADLARRLTIPAQVDFVRLTSYGVESESSGRVVITKDVELSIRGRHVLVVEDIVDSGHTLAWLREFLRTREPASLKVCALIDKRERREVDVVVDYTALEVDKGFLVGYGLDFAERHRHLPGIHEVRFVDEPSEE